MRKKAQAEFIIIVGIVLLSLVVIYYVSQSGIFSPSNIPENVFQKQKLVQESFLNLVRKGADQTLNVMETHGGYPTAELLGEGNYQTPQFAIFNGEGIPYWTRCEQNLVPSKNDVKRWFELSMENYIKTHTNELSGKYKNVTFVLSNLSVSVNILSNPRKIDITVNLPTRVDGYSLPNQLYPYKTSIETKFGEIYDFASDFSKAQVSKRFLEVFTTASIYLSKDADDGYPKLPTAGFFTDCGQTIYRTPQQISAYLKEIAEYVVTQTLWWQNMPVDLNEPKVYAINKEILGTEYKDLDPNLYLSDDFVFDTREPIVIANTKPAYTSIFWTATGCLSSYSMGYSVSYPVIVRVKDPLSGHYFNFAVLLFVDYKETNDMVDVEVVDGTSIKTVKKNVVKMVPGNCQDISAGQAACTDLSCSAKIKIEDESGSPISGAIASFGGCGLGTSDSSGYIEGGVKCGKSELNIYKNSKYDNYKEDIDSSSINATYILYSIPEFTAHFRKVTINKQCTIPYGMSDVITIDYIACSEIEKSCIGTPKITKCIVDNLNDYSSVELANSKKQFIISNIKSDSVNPNCKDTDACKQCQQSFDLGNCNACATSCIGSFSENVKISYIPSGNYYANATTLNLSSLKEAGGSFIGSYDLKSANDIYFNIPEGDPDYPAFMPTMISETKKLCLVNELAKCGIDPISNTEPETKLFTS